MFFAVLTWAIAAWLFSAVSSAHPVLAEEPKTKASSFVVLPVTQGDERLDELRRRAVELEEELASRGYERVAHESAATRFEELHSREPRSISAADVEVLLRDSELARRAAAARENADAKRYAERVHQRVVDRLESANHDDAVARAYFAACWAHVRALVNENDAPSALGVARRCVAETPDLTPRLRDHPPSVMRIFERVTSELSGPDASVLEVDSTPPGCRVLVDGRPSAATPSRLRVPVDQRYAVQVDCGGSSPARVHEMVSRSTPTVLAVDAMFERAVRTTDGALRLNYESANDPATEAHARAVAQVLEVDEVFLLSGAERGGLRIQRLGGKSETVADARRAGVLRTAVDALLQNAPVQERSAAPARSRAPEYTPPERARWPLPTGIALAGASLVLGTVGALMYRDHREAGDEFKKTEPSEPVYKPRGDTWQEDRPIPFAFVSVASGLMTAGAIMMTEPLDGTTRRWLSPLLAATGITLAGVGFRDIAQGDACAKNEPVHAHLCVDQEEKLNRGGLLVITAAPFLITSAVHLGEWLLRDKSADTGSRELSVYATPRGLGATLRF